MNTLQMYLDELADRCHETSKAHGFWDDKDSPSVTTQCLAYEALALRHFGEKVEALRTDPSPELPYAYRQLPLSAQFTVTEIGILSRLALIVSEVSEAVDALVDDPDNLSEELADIVIRVADLARGIDVELGLAIVAKSVKNESRSRLHGKLA